MATKVGNKYVGNVSHFSWWNCDSFSSVVSLTVTVVDTDGNPIPNAGVSLVVTTTNFNSYVQTTSNNGQVSGLIPSNQTLTINVYDYCGNIIYTSSIGPFAENTVLPNIVITSAMSQSTIVQGTLLKCDNTKVTNGYLVMRSGSQNYQVAVNADNGSFSFKGLVCNGSNSFTLEGFDFDLQQSTGLINYTFTLPTTSVGTLMTCSSLSEFISYTIDNNPTVFITTNLTCDAYTNAGLDISGQAVDNIGNVLHSVYITDMSNIPGIYPSSSSITNLHVEPDLWGNLREPGASIQFTLNHIGPIGSYYDLTFTGTYYNSSPNPGHITGTIHIKRDY